MRRVIDLFFALALITSLNLWGQVALRITQPANGTRVVPGQSVDVEVVVSGGTVTSVGILAPGYLKGDSVLNSPPYKFSFTVAPPPQIRLGINGIGAMGFTNSTQVLANTDIDIERPDLPEKISVDSSRIEIEVGSQIPIGVYGTYSDGSIIHLSRSTLTHYDPQAAGVVSVTADGVVIGIAPGSTKIVVRHGDARSTVDVTITPKRQ
jgi:hypothetical protein